MPFPQPYNGENVRVCRVEAISGLEQSFAEARPRALIQMATGAGKTLTASAFTYRLIKHAGARNVLFLVDRANLGRQAMAEFQQFVTPDGRKFTELYNVQHLTSNNLDGVCRVTLCTIQRLYAMLRFRHSWLNKPSRKAKSREETGRAWRVFNQARRWGRLARSFWKSERPSALELACQ
jgi:type I restriction enzyme R subunit